MPSRERRPTVSVVVPFTGSDEQLRRLLSTLSRLELQTGDEVIVADNRPIAASAERGPIRVLPAAGIRTPAFARNRAASQARGEWLVFVDADTIPCSSLLDEYFGQAPGRETAVLAGGILDTAPADGGIAARRAVARGHMSQTATMRRRQPYAQTANCAVRRIAFEQVGGFVSEARAGEDAELCFRLQRAGWTLEERPDAAVEHRGRETVGALLEQLARHGSGASWANRRFPGSFPAAGVLAIIRRLGHHGREATSALLRSDREAAAIALLDLLGTLAYELGRLLPNRPGVRL